jgi:peptide/nickel transport system substrate-binding protein
MRRTRVVAAAALIAASAMVLSACGSPGQAEDTSSISASASAPASGAGSASAPSSAAGTGESGTGGSETGSATGSSGSVSSGGAAVGEVGGSACGTPHGPYDDPGAPSGQVSVGFNELATSFNQQATHGNSTYNANPKYLLNGPSLFYYDDKNELINNDSFGTCTLVSLDPLTVKYTIKDGVKWSDGVPVTAADLLMSWAAQSGLYNTAEAEYDDEGNLQPSTGIAFDAASPGLALVTTFPEIGDNGQSLTISYDQFYVDYDVNLDMGVPAHVVAMHALKETDPAKATDDLVSLLKDTLGKVKDAAADQKSQLKAVADFWNTGFDTTQMPSDKSLYVSNGAYVLTDWKKDQYMTFTANPDYTWGPKPQVQTIVWTYAPDPTAAVQSLQNGDLDVINPQATADVASGVQKLADQGVQTISQDGAIYEHVDVVFDNGGPFDPKTYGGDKDKALKVRQAFLQTVPRQSIVDTLIKPLNPNAVLRQSFMLFPGQPGYDEMVKENGSAEYADAGSDAAIEKAKQLLAEAGVSTPVTARLLHADNNPRRANEYQLIAASAKKAGFDVIDGKNAKWASLLPNNKMYDASLFAWQSTSTGVGQNPPNYLCEDKATKTDWGMNNVQHYCNAEVNKNLIALNSEPDPDKQFQLMLNAEKQLWADGFGVLLFQYPDIVAYNSNKVSGVGYAPMSPTFLWNYWEWKTVS